MQKLFTLLAITTILFSCNQAAKEVEEETKMNEWTTNHLNGKVKTIVETAFTPDSTGAIAEMDSCCIEITMYNEMGYTAKYIEKNSQDVVQEETVMERIEGEKFKSAKTMKNGVLVWSRKATMNDDGEVLYATDYDSAGNATYYYSEMTRNEDNQLLGGKMHTVDSVYLGTWTRKYTNGMETGRSWIDSTGKLQNEKNSELNDKGFFAKTVAMQIDGDSTITTSNTFTYESFDELGNWTQRTEYNEGGKAVKVLKRTYAYYEED